MSSIIVYTFSGIIYVPHSQSIYPGFQRGCELAPERRAHSSNGRKSVNKKKGNMELYLFLIMQFCKFWISCLRSYLVHLSSSLLSVAVDVRIAYRLSVYANNEEERSIPSVHALVVSIFNKGALVLCSCKTLPNDFPLYCSLFLDRKIFAIILGQTCLPLFVDH